MLVHESWINEAPSKVGRQQSFISDVVASSDSLESFEHFFTEELISINTDQTKIFGAQTIENTDELKPNSKISKWKSISDEIRIWIFRIL